MAYESLRALRQKRALNIVWTAAGAYGFQPEFLAFYQDGEPDIYLNSIVGLVHRHYDAEKLTAYLRGTLDKSLLGELYTELFWLGLESAAYARELPARPVLAELRRQHAARFLREDVDLSFQQLMMRQELAHSLKCARCREILGEKTRLLNPWDRKLYEALTFSGSMSTEKIIAAMEGIIRKFFRWHWQTYPRNVLHFALPPALKALLLKVLLIHSRYRDEGNGSWVLNGNIAEGNSKSFWPAQGNPLPDDGELARCYGPALFTAERRASLEGVLCRGVHGQVRLWFTAEKGEVQPENQEYFAQHQVQFRTELNEFSRRLQNALQVHRQPMELPARSGRLAAGRIWRGAVMGENRVFSVLEPAHYSDFSVLLLLDASASRQGRQAVIANQAYLIAEALRRAGIPLMAVAFFSQGGCTVLQRLKDFGESSAEGLLAYKTQGWNRDGLALRAVPELWGKAAEPRKKIIFILTDASPSDDHDIPRQGIKPASLYGGEAAVTDAAQGVKELKRQGFQVMALVNSVMDAKLVTDAASRIYGEDYICLQDLSSLAQKVGNLLDKEIMG